MNERLYWLSFSVFPGVGPKLFSKLLKHFGSAEKAWKASAADLQSILSEALTAKFDSVRNEISPLAYKRRLDNAGVDFLILSDKEYPKLLSQIPNPPFVLYIKGNPVILNTVKDPSASSGQRLDSSAKPQNDNFVAVVGTRKITGYGREVTELFTQDLTQAGFAIVSGLAVGVDATAHQTTIENGGRTIAVLGCGVDCCTPLTNQKLYDEILKRGGTIVSELPLGHGPTKGTFPSRNRIIAGLSQAVLVTEGAEDSGSLITAEYGLKFNRSVFAVPGPITSHLSKGPYKLIQKGAKLVIAPSDILAEFNINKKGDPPASQARALRAGTKEERMILEMLTNESLSFDEIVRNSKMDSAKVGSLLSLMEIKGMVKSDSNIFHIILG